jgi:hypothetical protein
MTSAFLFVVEKTTGAKNEWHMIRSTETRMASWAAEIPIRRLPATFRSGIHVFMLSHLPKPTEPT